MKTNLVVGADEERALTGVDLPAREAAGLDPTTGESKYMKRCKITAKYKFSIDLTTLPRKKAVSKLEGDVIQTRDL